MEEAYAVETRQTSKNHVYSGNLNYQYDFTGRARVLNIAYQFSSTPFIQQALSGISGVYAGTDIPYSSDGETRTNEHTLQVHYFDPLSDALRLESGAGYIYRDYYTETDYFLSENIDGGDIPPPFNTLMETKSHIVNAYAGITYSRKRFSGSFKLKADYLDDGEGTLVKERDRKEKRISQTSLNLMPEARINVSFPKSTFSRLSLSYRLWKYRPNIRMLSAHTDYSNPNLIVTGNPGLKQEATHYFNLGTSVKSVSLGVNYSYSGNKILPYWYENEDGAIVRSYRNYGKYRSFGFSSSAMYFKNPFTVGGMLSATYSKENTGMGETGNRFHAMASLHAGYTFKNQLRLSAQGSYMYFYNTGYRDMKMPPVNLGFSVKKSFFNERLEAEASISDILNIRRKTTTNIHTDDFMLHQRMEKRRIPLEITMNLRIGSFKVKPIKTVRQGAVMDDVSKE